MLHGHHAGRCGRGSHGGQVHGAAGTGGSWGGGREPGAGLIRVQRCSALHRGLPLAALDLPAGKSLTRVCSAGTLPQQRIANRELATLTVELDDVEEVQGLGGSAAAELPPQGGGPGSLRYAVSPPASSAAAAGHSFAKRCFHCSFVCP